MLKNSEHEIVEKILEGEATALHKLYTSYYNEIFSFVQARITDKNVAEELTQDIFINVLDSFRNFRFESSIKTFMFKIARNKIIDYFRKKKNKDIAFSCLPECFVDGLLPVFDEHLEKQELIDLIEQSLSDLPHDYQVVLRLKYQEDKSVQEIARLLVRSFKSTESLLYRARQAFIGAYTELSQ